MDLLTGVKEKGFVLSWMLREEVFSYFFVGGFLIYSGWNSIMESIVAGVFMICWLYYVD